MTEPMQHGRLPARRGTLVWLAAAVVEALALGIGVWGLGFTVVPAAFEAEDRLGGAPPRAHRTTGRGRRAGARRPGQPCRRGQGGHRTRRRLHAMGWPPRPSLLLGSDGAPRAAGMVASDGASRERPRCRRGTAGLGLPAPGSVLRGPDDPVDGGPRRTRSPAQGAGVGPGGVLRRQPGSDRRRQARGQSVQRYPAPPPGPRPCGPHGAA